MKNSPATIVSKSQRVRANAVWLMNAASLAIAIGAVNQVSKSPAGNLVSNLVPTAQAVDYFYAGGTNLKAGPGALWIGTTAKANNTAADWTNASSTTASTDSLYFGSSTAIASGYTWSSTIDPGSSNLTWANIIYNSGANAYTITSNNTRKITVGNIVNNSTSAQTFSFQVASLSGNSAGAAGTINAATGSIVLAGSATNSSYIINPYAYDYAKSVAGGSMTDANAKTFASSGSVNQSLAIADNATSNRFVKLTGASTITVSQAIGDAWRGNFGSATSAYRAQGSGNLIITNTGTTNLSGWNTYTGTTAIGDGTASGGVVVIGSPYAFGGNRLADASAATYTTAGAALGYGGSGTTAYFAGTVATGFKNATQAFGAVTVYSGFTVDLNGQTQIATNALTINGAGASSAGVLKNSSTTAATYSGAVTLGSASTITAGTGNITLSGGLATSTNAATFSGAQTTSVTGVLSGTGSINKTGAGTLTLSGNNTYTGSINIDQGVVSLVAASGSALGTGTGALSFGASNTPTLTLGGRSATMGNLSSSNANAVIQNDNATAATFTSSAPGTTTFAGKLSDGATGGKLSFVKAGSGTLTLSNTQDYTGTTTIAGGTLSLTGSTKIGSAVTVNSGATLSGSGTVNDSLTVSGSISPGVAGVGNLTAGATSLQSGGTLNVQIYDFTGAAGSTGWDLLTSTGAITVNSTSDLTLNKFNIVLSSITGSGVDTTGSALNFTNSSNYSLKILTGTSISGFDASKFNITGSISNTNTGVWSIGLSDNDINLIYTAANAQFWNGASGWDASATVGGTGIWDSTGYSSSLDTFFAGTGAAVSVDTVTTSKAIKFQSDSYVLSGGTITLTGADSSTNKIDVGTGLTTTINSKIVSATSTLNKTGLGILVLGGANGTSGISSGISIANGTIKIASADALGSSGSAVTVESGATLDLNGQSVANTNSLTLSGTGAASAGGALVNTSTNAATYAGLATLGAATTINASSGSISLTNGGTITGSGFGLTVTGSNDTSIASIIGTGAGTLTKTGNGTLTLSNANTYTGATTVSAGTLKLANAGALGSSGATYSATTIASGATLDLNGQNVSNTNTLTLSGTGAASAGGALINSSVSASTFAGLATLGAATTINASSGSISLTNGGTITGSGFGLTVTGSNNTSIASIIGTGAGTLTKEGTGILTLSGANTYTGATTVSAGRLQLGNATALGGSAAGVTVASGATLDLNGQTISNTNALTLSGTGAASAGGALINSSSTAASFGGQISFNAATTINAASGDITLASASNINGRTYALTVDGSYNTTLNGTVNSGTNTSGNGGYITYIKKGTGTLNLNGYNNASADSLGRGLTALSIEAGSVKLGHTQALGANGANPFGTTWAGYGMSAIISSGATLDINGLQYGKTPIIVMSGTGAASMGGAIVNTSTTAARMQGIYLLAADATIASNNGGLDINANSTNVKFFNIRNRTLTLTGTGTSGSDIVSTAIIGTGSLRKTGTGSWTLNPGNSGVAGVNNLYLDYTSDDQSAYSTVAAPSVANSNFFSGTIAIEAGTLKLGKDNAFGSTSAGGTSVASAAVSSGATLDLAGRTIAVATTLSLSGTGASGAGGALVNTSTTASASYSGLVSLTGDTTINASSGSISLANAGTISGSGFGLTVTGSNNTSIASIIGTGAGTLTKTGTGTLTLSGANTYTGATTVSNGILNIGSAGSIASSAVTVANAATLKATNSYTGASMPASAIADAITLNSGAIIDLTAGSLKATSLTVAALSGSDVTTISYTIGKSFALTGGLTLNGNLSLDLTSALTGPGDYDVLTWTGAPTGVGAISFVDHSTADWTMTGIQTSGNYQIKVVAAFTEGGTYTSGNISVPTGASIGTLSGGTANIGANNTVISTLSGTGAVALTNGAKVKVEAGTSSGVISGTGALVKQGTGVLELTAANTYTAKTEITEGTLKVSSKNASTGVIDGLGSHTDLDLGSGSNNGKLSIAATGAATLDKNVSALSSGSNILENSGTGLLTVTGSLTKDGTVLTLAGGAEGMKVTGSIIGSSANSDLVVSTGTVTVSSSNSYNGPTFVQNTATLIADNASATGAGIVNVASGATLQVGTSTNYALTLTTGGFALTNGAIIRVYVGSVDITGLTANAGAAGFDTNYTHYDLTTSAGVTYSTLTTSGALDLTGVTAGGITIQVYSTDAINGTTGLEKAPFYDFKFLQAGSVTHSLGAGGNIASLFTINTDNLKYEDGTTVTGAKYAGNTIAGLIKMYTVTSGGNTILMMSIPEPSTYGLGLGALALAAVAIRRRKQKQKKETV